MSAPRLRIGFMGTPDFAVPALAALCEGPHEVVCVYSQPPRPKGRGQQVQLSPVHEFAKNKGIPVFTPQSLKTREAKAEFASQNLDLAVVAAYGLILPEAVLNAPAQGCLNIHASILPRWRGAAPIQYAIWKGDSETGVTIMQMEKGLDTGPMLAMEYVPVTAHTTASTLHDELSRLGADMIRLVVEDIAAGRDIVAEKQDDAGSTYAAMLKKEDGIVDWSQGAVEIDRQVRALNPWPGVWSVVNGKRIKILQTDILPEGLEGPEKLENGGSAPGTLLDRSGACVCGAGGILRLVRVQPEGKNPMDFASALNGGYIRPGDRFE